MTACCPEGTGCSGRGVTKGRGKAKLQEAGNGLLGGSSVWVVSPSCAFYMSPPTPGRKCTLGGDMEGMGCSA